MIFRERYGFQVYGASVAERIYLTAGALLAASHGLEIERAVRLAEMIVRLAVELELLKREHR
jgi:hypothetical protein